MGKEKGGGGRRGGNFFTPVKILRGGRAATCLFQATLGGGGERLAFFFSGSLDKVWDSGGETGEGETPKHRSA